MLREGMLVGSTFGRYRIERPLGEGGMGAVYEAHDTVLRRSVALKVVKGDAHAEARARLLREARAAAALRHPNAVAVFDVGEIEGVSYIAMELAQGSTLSTYAHAAVPLERKAGWLLEIARALAAAHRAGLVHRDVKPENVMICTGGEVKVLDFGIAKRAGDASAEAASGPASFRTQEGIVTGTPRYMAPEQLAGAPLDGRTDQFAWGVVAYELLSGIHPQSTTGSAERWAAPPAGLVKVAPNVPPALADIVMHALERLPEHRFASTDELVRALEGFLGVTTGAAAAPEPSTEQTSADAPTMDLQQATAETAPVPVSIARTEPLLPRTRDARVLDPLRPAWARVLAPVVGAGIFLVGLALMLVEALHDRSAAASALSKGVIRAGWLVIYLAPLLHLARGMRPATIEAREGAARIRNARGMSQMLDAGDVAGASLAPLDGGRATIAIAPRRVVSSPILIDVASEEDAHAILAALGASRAVTGTLAWPLRQGPLDRLALTAALGWRIAIVSTWVPLFALDLLGFGIAVLAGLVATALAFTPRPGPHVELSAERLRILASRGGRPDVPLRDVEDASATDDALVLRLRSGETLTIAAPIPRLSARGLTREQRERLVAHIRAASARARAAWS